MANTVKGKVRWFDNGRGYGFVTLDGDTTAKEYFVHYSSIQMEGYKTLAANQAVELELADTEKGTQAVKVKPV